MIYVHAIITVMIHMYVTSMAVQWWKGVGWWTWWKGAGVCLGKGGVASGCHSVAVVLSLALSLALSNWPTPLTMSSPLLSYNLKQASLPTKMGHT